MAVALKGIVLDDHPLVARGTADFLKSHCGFHLTYAVSNTADFWESIAQSRSLSLLVVDFWLPDGASLVLLSQVRERYPRLPLLVVSADDDGAVQEKARAAGASGFLHKQESVDVFSRVTLALLNGKTWFRDFSPPTRREFSARELPVTAGELGLTARQGQVLAMMLKGLPNKRIALALSLSEQTVKEHVTAILDKLGVRNRIEVITQFRGRRLE